MPTELPEPKMVPIKRKADPEAIAFWSLNIGVWIVALFIISRISP